MVRVVQRGRYSVYVYDESGEPHHRPHCHVHWSGEQTSVALSDLTVLAGPPLPAAARQLLWDHIDEIRAAWNRLNPGRPIR